MNGWSPHGHVGEGGTRMSDRMCERPSSVKCGVYLSAHPFSDLPREEIVLPRLAACTLYLLVGSRQRTPGFCPFLSFSLLVSLSPSLLNFLFLSNRDTYPSLSINGSQIQYLPCLCLISSKKSVKKNPPHDSLIVERGTMFLFYLVSLGEWTNWVQTCSRPS